MSRIARIFTLVLLAGLNSARGDNADDPLRLISQARDLVAQAKVDEEWEIELAYVLVDVAGAFATAADMDAANAVVQMIVHDTVKDSIRENAIEAIARAQARRGDFDGAFRTLSNPRAGHAMLARRDIAKLQARLGRRSDAIQTCEKVFNSRRASGFLIDIATIFQDSHDLESARTALNRARRILEERPPDQDGDTALRELAVGYAHLGDDQTARALFALVTKLSQETDEHKNDSAPYIAIALADAGYFDEAFKTASLANPDESDVLTGGKRVESIYGQIGLAAANSSHWDVARQVLIRIENKTIKARVLGAMARTLAVANKRIESDEAYALGKEYIIATKEEASPFEVILACAELAKAQLVDGNIAEAIAITENMPDTGARSELLGIIAKKQIELSDLTGAVKTSQTINHKGHRATTLEAIAEAEAKSTSRAVFDRLRSTETDPIIAARILLGRAKGLLSKTASTDQ